MVSPNPYQPAPETRATLDDPVVESATTSGRNWLGHIFGLISFVIGITSWLVLHSIPTAHPAYGGASFSRVVTVLLISTALCVLTMLAVGFLAYRRRAPWTLLYAAPALGYVEYLLLMLII